MCVEVNTKRIVNLSPYGEYGNCALCFSKGVRDTRCLKDSCINKRYARIMVFTNRYEYYINPDLLYLIFADEDIPVTIDTNQERNGRSYVQMCVEVDTQQIVSLSPYREYGNCALCFSKGVRDTRCLKNSCINKKYARVLFFTNRYE